MKFLLFKKMNIVCDCLFQKVWLEVCINLPRRKMFKTFAALIGLAFYAVSFLDFNKQAKFLYLRGLRNTYSKVHDR